MPQTDKGLAIRFPLRMERAQLLRESSRDAYASLLALMAQTPRGSWQAQPSFGLRERLEELQQMIGKEAVTEEQRKHRCESLTTEINDVLLDLGLEEYCVDRVELHLPENDVRGRVRIQWASHLFDDLSAVFVLRPVEERAPGSQAK